MAEVTEPPRLPVPGRVSQATHVEQSRAAAEVFAAMQAARSLPRSETWAAERMRETCGRYDFASRAFYRVPRGGGSASGPSVHLARELARIFGNVHYGIAELDRDPVGPDRERGRSEMIAFAWDLESNVRSSSAFIVEHARDKTVKGESQVDPLVTLQSVYESNANAGARRVRQAILGVLPTWFVDEAVQLCNEALVKGDGKPLAERVAAAVRTFERDMSVRVERLEARLGKPAGRWTAHDVAELVIIGQSIRRNETTAADEFPVHPVTPAELAPPASSEGPKHEAHRKAATKPRVEPADPEPIADRLNALKVKPADRAAVVSGLLRQPVAALHALSESEQEYTATGLQTVLDEPDPGRRQVHVDDMLAAGRDLLQATEGQP